MGTITKLPLSGSTNGRQIKIVATSTPGTTIHTAVSGTTNIDEIWLAVVNSSTSAIKITIEFGGTTSPDDLIEFTVPPEDGYYWIVKGMVLQNSLVVRAFAGTTNLLMINGFVNRIEP